MAENKNLLMVTVSGQDRPGITATFTRVLMEHEVELVDIEQASLQNLLGLYFLLDLTTAKQSADSVIKDLLYEASQLNLTLNFRLFAQHEIKAVHQKNLYVLTHFGSTRALAELSKILGEEDANIETISSLSHHGARSIEMTINVNGAVNLGRLKERIMVKSRELGMDLSFQKMEAYRKNKRLVFFDMDSTLVDMEIIDEMAKKAGVHHEVARITEKAMRGDLDFESALIQRVALLKGLTVQDLVDLREHIPLSEGAEELATTLKWLGYKLGIVTGGFDFFAQDLKERLGLDYAFANRLEIKRGRVDRARSRPHHRRRTKGKARQPGCLQRKNSSGPDGGHWRRGERRADAGPGGPGDRIQREEIAPPGGQCQPWTGASHPYLSPPWDYGGGHP